MNGKILNRYRDFVWGEHDNHNTRLTYTDHPRVMLAHIKKPLQKLTRRDIRDYAEYCYAHKRKNGNAIRFWAIQQFFNWAKKEKILTKKLTMPKVSREDAGKRALNNEDTDKLFAAIEQLSPLHRLVFYLEYDTIRRPKEICLLKLTDRHGGILRYNGKTGIKQAVMTETLEQAWDDYLKVRPIPATPEDEEYLILCDYGQFRGRRLKANTMLTRIIREIVMYAQIEIPDGEKPTNYLIKRTAITRQLKECSDPKIIQMQAGHTKLETTMKYNRIEDKDIKEYLDIFEHKRNNIKRKSRISKDKSF